MDVPWGLSTIDIVSRRKPPSNPINRTLYIILPVSSSSLLEHTYTTPPNYTKPLSQYSIQKHPKTHLQTYSKKQEARSKMCGPSRPSSGSLIAVIFPSSSSSSSASSTSSISSSFSNDSTSSPTSNASYSLFFKNTTHADPDPDTQVLGNKTKALFRISDPLIRRSFQESAAVHVRIEYDSLLFHLIHSLFVNCNGY